MRIIDFIIVLPVLCIGYCYVLYPVVIYLLAKFFPASSGTDESFEPSVSIIISVFNEEAILERCLESLLRLEYPPGFFEIVAGSDGSTDRTNEILARYSSEYSFVRPFIFSERRGKMMVLNDLVAQSKGEILFFIDADVRVTPESIRKHVRHYADQDTGAVAGAYAIESHERRSLFKTENNYITIEESIRKHESAFASTVGLFGGNYSMRRQCWRVLPDSLVHDDLYSVLSILHQSKRILFEPEAISTDEYQRSLNDEYKRKSRFASRGYHTLSFFPLKEILLPGKISFLLWSHKLLRWMTPFFLLAIFFSSLAANFLYSGVFYSAVLYCFFALTLVMLIGWFAEEKNISIPGIRQLSWLMMMSAAYAAGTVKFLFGRDTVLWAKSTRVVPNLSIRIKEGAGKE